MHETGIVKDIIEAAVTAARENHAGRITAIDVAIGDDSHVTEEAFLMNFLLFSQDTIAEGATVRISHADPVLTCPDCHHEGWAAGHRSCPRCDGDRIEVSPVRGCVLKAIDIDESGDH